MFNDMLIVTTAISSFNNAALFSPLFLVIGLLMLPCSLWLPCMAVILLKSWVGTTKILIIMSVFGHPPLFYCG